MNTTEARGFLKETFDEWKDDDALQWGAALAYYALLSLAPLLLLLLSMAGIFWGREAASGRLAERFETWVAPEVAETLTKILENAGEPGSGWAAVVGFGVLLLGASGLFTQLKNALNHFWDLEPQGDGGWRRSVLQKILDRLLAFGMVLLSAVLVLVTLASTTVVSSLTEYAEGLLPFDAGLAHAIQLAVTLLVFTLLVAFLFKYLPDGDVEWGDVWVGAAVTAGLFVLGQWLLGFYLSRDGVGSAHGAAGSLIVLLIWIYYNTQILFVGAEITQVWARRYGSRIE